MKTYVEEVNKRIELVKKTHNKEMFDYYVYQLIEYLDGLNWFVEEEKKHKFCAICGRPLFVVRDRLTCVEIHN